MKKKQSIKILLQKAADPSTSSEILDELSNHKNEKIRRTAWLNPNLSVDAWSKAFLNGEPEAWGNPSSVIYVFLRYKCFNENQSFEESVLRVVGPLWNSPKRCTEQGIELIWTKIIEINFSEMLDVSVFEKKFTELFPPKVREKTPEILCRILFWGLALLGQMHGIEEAIELSNEADCDEETLWRASLPSNDWGENSSTAWSIVVGRFNLPDKVWAKMIYQEFYEESARFQCRRIAEEMQDK